MKAEQVWRFQGMVSQLMCAVLRVRVYVCVCAQISVSVTMAPYPLGDTQPL